MSTSTEHIAVIGMAARFPGAPDVAAFRANLDNGVESIRTVSESELHAAGVAPELLDNPAYVRATATLDGYDHFDAAFFDISPGEAALLDPQHRIFLETCWRAFEDGGYAGCAAGSRTGVFAGSGGLMATYLVSPDHILTDALGPTASRGHVGNDKDYLATRVAYRLDLRGPVFTVQTACSTSLVAVHQACNSLRAGECDMALAGGVTIRIPHTVGYLYEEDNVFSPDGHCRAFDAGARGTVFGSGAGVVLLKPLSHALRDNDRIHAVIRGSAVNNDGARKQSYWASSAEGLEQVIVDAQRAAGVDAGDIGYVESHGTGTLLGDPVEIFAMNRAFRRSTERKQFCAVGSVKTNIGHLEAAAGVAGLIKATLALKHRSIPQSLHFETPNPHIRFDRSPFYVAAERTPFVPSEENGRYLAAVSSMGIGGTNAHVILEAAPEFTSPQVSEPPRPRIFTVSARDAETLERLRVDSAKHVEHAPLADACRTASAGRGHFAERMSIVCDEPGALAGALRQGEASRRAWIYRGSREEPPRIGVIAGDTCDAPALVALIAELRAQPVTAEVLAEYALTIEETAGKSLDVLLEDGDAAALRTAAQAVATVALEALRRLGVSPVAQITANATGDPSDLTDAECNLLIELLPYAPATGTIERFSLPVLGFTRLLARVYAAGANIRWDEWHRRSGAMLSSLPVYPLQSRRHWMNARSLRSESLRANPETGNVQAASAPIVFCYSGQGSQWAGMAAGYQDEPACRAVVERCCEAFAPYLERPLREILEGDDAPTDIREVQAAQFTMHAALTVRWLSRGIEPAVLIGHSLGEISAAWASGILELEDAARIIHHRTVLLTPIGGAMAVVELSAAETRGELTGSLGIASVNGPETCVVSGESEDVEAFIARMQERNIFCKKINVDVAGHSRLIDPLLPEFRRLIADVAPRPGRYPVHSTVTGRRERGEAFTPAYWARNLREPVLFWPVVETLAAETIFVEISPHPLLLANLRKARPGVRAYPSLLRDDAGVFEDSLRKLRRAARPRTESAFHGRPVDLAGEGIAVRQTRLSLENVPWIAEHRVQNNMLLPGTGFIEMACAHLAAGGDTLTFSVEQLRFRQGLYFDQKGREVQTSFIDTDGGSVFRVHSRAPDAGEWTLHCEARPGSVTPQRPDPLDLDELRARLSTELSATDFYAAHERIGVSWGPAFQSQHRFFRGRGEALRRVDCGTDRAFFVHPAVLDVCIQSMNAADLDLERSEAPGPFLFHGVDRLHVYEQPHGELWCYAWKIQGEDGPAFSRFDALITGADGRIFMEWQGMTLQYLEPDRRRFEDWLYDVTWEPCEGSASGTEDAAWLVLGVAESTGAHFVEALRQRGLSARLIATEAAADLAPILAETSGDRLAVAYLGALDHLASGDNPVSSATEHTVAAVQIVHALAAESRPVRMYIATAGAQAVHGGDVAPAGAPLWGLARSIAAEHQELWGGLIDLAAPASAQSGAADLTAAWIESPRSESMLAVRNSLAYAPRLRRSTLENEGATLVLHADATYLITGGLGDLGLLVAERLANRGARRLVLAGRHLPHANNGSSHKLETISRLRANGVQVELVQCDVADEAELRDCLARIPEDAPLRGVIHAAGVNNPATILDCDKHHVREHLRAKVDGAWLLHQLTHDLDFCVYYSSASTLIASPLLGAYAAANAFLDGLAQMRTQQGRPTTCVNWGYWGQRGMAVRGHQYGEASEELKGMVFMEPGDCLDCLEALVNAGRNGVCVLAADWPRWARYHPDAASDPFLRYVIQALPAGANAGAGVNNDVSQPEQATSYLRETAASILRIPAAEIRTDASLSRLGLDSMMALQLKRRLLAETGINLPIATLLRGFDLRRLGEELAALAQTNTATTNDVHAAQEDAAAPATSAEVTRATAPLSFSQEGYYIFARLAPKSPFYIANMAVDFEGDLDPARLEAALHAVRERYEILRTRFPLRDGLPVQEVVADVRTALPLEDLSHYGAEEQHGRLSEIVSSDAMTPFALDQAPPFRVRLLRLGERRWMLLAAAHHILFDGLSQGIFVDLLAESYRSGEALPSPAWQYADFARHQRAALSDTELSAGLAYWRAQLKDVPAFVALPFDRERPDRPLFRGDVVSIDLSESLAQAEALSRAQDTTLFSTLLAAVYLSYWIWSDQQDLVVGTVGSGRDRPELERLPGDITNFLPLRAQISEAMSFRELLDATAGAVVDAFARQKIPFARIVEALQLRRSVRVNPVYNTAFLLHDERFLYPALDFGPELNVGLNFKNRDLARVAVLDLRLEAMHAPGRLRLDCEFNTDLFDTASIADFLELYRRAFAAALKDPAAALAVLRERVLMQDATQLEDALCIAASFTADPVEAPLRENLAEPVPPIVIAPFHQIFQELLQPDSNLRRAVVSVVLLNFEDLLPEDAVDAGRQAALVERHTDDLLQACAEFAPHCLVLCPVAPEREAALAETLRVCEERLVRGLPDTRVITPAELFAYYPQDEYYNARGRAIGGISYQPDFYESLGSMLARWMNVRRDNRCKVIALDCDDTLWDGIVGEDGVDGIVLDEERLDLQRFLLRQREAGRLLVLCSKNNDADVTAVFEQRGDMVLRLEHISGRRVNWAPKSANLLDLARELNVGAESFVFLDDNPLECAEVRENASGVEVHVLPAHPRELPAFLRSLRSLDLPDTNRTDRDRARLYAEERDRTAARDGAHSLDRFLAGLELQVSIEAPVGDDLERVVQLAQRTNQMNFTTRRRDRAQLQQLLTTHECEVVRVRDRFGDYGLVGVILYRLEADALHLDSFCLSCRALGRGVEHRMLRRLATLAYERGITELLLEFEATAKNAPARAFLESLPDANYDEARRCYRFDAAPLCECTIPGATPGAVSHTAASAPAAIAKTTATPFTATPAQPTAALPAAAGSATELERQIVAAWQRILRREDIAPTDNFFQLGGNSLLATQFVSLDHAGVELSLSDIFDHPTPVELADVVLARMAAGIPPQRLRELLERIDAPDRGRPENGRHGGNGRYDNGHESNGHHGNGARR